MLSEIRLLLRSSVLGLGSIKKFFPIRMSHNEVKEALKAQVPTGGDSPKPTIFSKIIDGSIPATIIHEDEHCVAFKDANPQAPVHFLVVPRKIITGLSAVKEEDKQILGHLLSVVPKLAEQQKLEKGYRVVINNGPQGCQSVYHLHLHVLGGRQLGWPPC